MSVTVLQPDQITGVTLLESDHGAAEARRSVLDHQVSFSRHLGRTGLGPPRGREYVSSVSVVAHQRYGRSPCSRSRLATPVDRDTMARSVSSWLSVSWFLVTSTDHTVTRAWPACALGGWSAAWHAGRCSPDDVADTLATFADRHIIDDLTDQSRADGDGVLGILAILRGVTAMSVRLPSAGDPHGLPPGRVTSAAFAAGEALLVDDGNSLGPLALVPALDGDVCRWTVDRYADPLPADPSAPVGEIEYQLRQSVSEAASLATRVGSRAGNPPADLRGSVRALTLRNQVDLPPHDDTRASRVIDTAAQIEAIVTVAGAGDVTFGATSSELHSGDGELRRLVTLARAARGAAVNRVISEFLPTIP